MIKESYMLDYIPNVLRPEELNQIPVDPKLVKVVSRLVTPDEVLSKTDFSDPEVIRPFRYQDFDSLIKDRDKIRYLQLLPAKTNEERARYHATPKELLFRKVLDYFGDSSMVLAVNAYPDSLPEDLGQYLLWVRNRDVQKQEIHEFIAKCMQGMDLKEEDLILFERPLGIQTKFVRGSYSEMRHIHFWMRLKD